MNDSLVARTPKKMARASVLQQFHVDGIRATGRTVGCGTYATVLEMGLRCASKRPHRILFESARPEQNEDMLRLMEEECQLLNQLRHPNIVQCFGVHLEKNSQLPAFVMEYLPTSLRTALDSGLELPMATKYGILRDVALGLCYLHGHDQPIIHHDLCADSVFLTTNFSAKISCVSIAKMLDFHENAASQLRAPEMLEEAVCTSKVDIYCYGFLILHILNGRRQQSLLSTSALSDSGISDMSPPEEHEFKVGYYTHCVSEPNSSNHPLSKLVCQCLDLPPSDRPEATEVLQQLSVAMSALFTPEFQQLAEGVDGDDTIQLHEGYTQSHPEGVRENKRLTRELGAMKRENRRLKDNLQAVSSENKQLKVAVKEIHIKNQRMQDEISIVTMQHSATHNENLQLKKVVSSYVARLQCLDTEVSQLGQDLLITRQMCHSLEQEKEDLIRENERLTNELDAARSQAERLELDMKEMQKLTLKLEELQCQNQTLAQELDAVKDRNQEMEEEFSSLAESDKKEIQQLQQELKAVHAKLQQQSGKIDRRLKEVKNDNKRLKLDHKRELGLMQMELQQHVKTTTEQNEKLQQEREANERLKEKLKTVTQKMDEVQQSLAEEVEKQRLTAESKVRQRKVQQRVEDDIASLQQDIKDVRSEIVTLTHDVFISVNHCLQKLRE